MIARDFKTDARLTRAAERTLPSKTLYGGAEYRPSWTHHAPQRGALESGPRTTWTDRLGGHCGIVGERLAARRGATA